MKFVRSSFAVRVMISISALVLSQVCIVALIAPLVGVDIAVWLVAYAVVMLFAGAGLAYWLILGLRAQLHNATATAKRIASGDLSEPLDANGGDQFSELQLAHHDMSERMFDMVAKIRGGTIAVAASAAALNDDNKALSARIESQASSLEETASAMEELAATVKQNAENVNNANALATSAAESAAKGGEVVGNVVQTMESIRASSRKIVDIISVIDGIAFQTNILALNAAVEAARAGKEGRGFAVVAAEVRTLAQRSANAAKEIKNLIVDSVEKVGIGSKLVDEAGASMQELVTNVRRVNHIMGDISAASNEQDAGIQEINRAIMQIEGLTQKNVALVEETSRLAAGLREQAVSLSQTVSVFKLGEREFGSAAEAEALVKDGIGFLMAHGKQALIDEVKKLNKGLFIDRDLYLIVYGLDTINLAHGTNPRLVGADGNVFKDVDGKYFIKDIVATAQRNGSGWVDYKFVHPLTQEIKVKSAYFEKAGDVILSCGYYKH